MTARAAAIRRAARAAIVIAMAAFLSIVAFFWPFLVAPGKFGPNYAPPLIFGVLLVIVLCVVVSEIAEGVINSKALAMLGVLSAVNAAIRPLGAGTAGIKTVFFILVLAGRVYGPAFGFVLGCTSLFDSALITGGVGPWMPCQMFGCAAVDENERQALLGLAEDCPPTGGDAPSPTGPPTSKHVWPPHRPEPAVVKPALGVGPQEPYGVSSHRRVQVVIG
ncbi:hypothetical protein ACFXA3_03685 [Streptomyces sp. NPDC059456]|uniref:hypothetical protein n=1 Tax=Streptomyces sp. NPDC059456 TaxID=3346838 RepID=UPI00369C9157